MDFDEEKLEQVVLALFQMNLSDDSGRRAWKSLPGSVMDSRVHQALGSERCCKTPGLVVRTREDSALLQSNGDSGEDTHYGILRPKRRNAFLIGNLWTTSDWATQISN
jgi:hypothetical protein